MSATPDRDCTPARVATHKQLARCLRTVPSVEAVDVLLPADSPSGYLETEVVCTAERRGTIPNSVSLKIVASGLAIGPSDHDNDPDYRRVVVR